MQHVIKMMFLSVAAVMLLSGCLDYEEDMTINADMSGEVSLTLSLPESISTKYSDVADQFSHAKVKALLEKADGVRLLSYEAKPGLKPVVKMRLGFDSLEDWNQAVSLHPKAAVLAGTFTKQKNAKGWVIERQLGGKEASGEGLPDSNHVLYTTRFKSQIKGTNSKQPNMHGNEVRYRYQLRDVIEQKPLMSTTVQAQFPWLWVGLGSVGAVIVLWQVWKFINAKSKRKAA